mgnify:CR=1 FL=1
MNNCRYPNKSHCKASLGCDACQWFDEALDMSDEPMDVRIEVEEHFEEEDFVL